MKQKTLVALLCVLLTVPMISGCGKQSETSTSSSVSSTQEAGADNEQSLKGIPNDVQQRLQEALDIEPITIPTEEWTIETLCQATYINGRNLTVPCTLRDLGDGFAILEDDSHSVVFSESSRRAGAHLTYYGTYIGSFSVEDCDNKADISDSPIIMLDLVFDEFENNEVTPFSCNGFGFGKTKDMMKKQLYFMDVYQESQEKGYCVLETDIDDVHLICNFSDDKLSNFTFTFQSNS